MASLLRSREEFGFTELLEVDPNQPHIEEQDKDCCRAVEVGWPRARWTLQAYWGKWALVALRMGG